jgi:hypothetical protein
VVAVRSQVEVAAGIKITHRDSERGNAVGDDVARAGELAGTARYMQNVWVPPLYVVKGPAAVNQPRQNVGCITCCETASGLMRQDNPAGSDG